MNTRHLYTFQDGRVLVLEHIVAIGSPYPSRYDEGLFFQVDMLGDVCYCYPDIEFEKTRSALQNYKTTERAELIKALAAI